MMTYLPRSSFAQGSEGIPTQVKKKQTIQIVGVLGTFMLIVSVLSVGGMYFYERHLNIQLGTLKAELDSFNHEENENKMTEIKEYDEKLISARSLLDNHVAISRLFGIIGNSTKETIRFTSLEYTYDPGFEVELTLVGDTKELESVVLQKMQFIRDSLFSNFLVEDISVASADILDSQNNRQPVSNVDTNAIEKLGVGFSVKGVFEKNPIRYDGLDHTQEGNASTSTASTTTSDFDTTTNNNQSL